MLCEILRGDISADSLVRQIDICLLNILLNDFSCSMSHTNIQTWIILQAIYRKNGRNSTVELLFAICHDRMQWTSVRMKFFSLKLCWWKQAQAYIYPDIIQRNYALVAIHSITLYTVHVLAVLLNAQLFYIVALCGIANSLTCLFCLFRGWHWRKPNIYTSPINIIKCHPPICLPHATPRQTSQGIHRR